MPWGSGLEIQHPRTAWSASLKGGTSDPSGWSRVTNLTYTQQTGTLVRGRFGFTAGAGATWGSGYWHIVLPITPRTQNGNTLNVCGESYLYDVGYGYLSQCRVFYTGSEWRLVFPDYMAAYLGSTVIAHASSPTSGASFNGYFFYEAASV